MNSGQRIKRWCTHLLLGLFFSEAVLAEGILSEGLNLNPLGVCRFGMYDSLFATTAIFAPDGWTISDVEMSKGHLADVNLPDPDEALELAGMKGHLAIFIRDYKGLVGNNHNWERVVATLTLQSLTTQEQLRAKVKRIHGHGSDPYLIMEILGGAESTSLHLRYSQLRPQRQICDSETGQSIVNKYARPAVMTLAVSAKGGQPNKAPDTTPIGAANKNSACDCYSSYYDTIYGYTVFVAPHGWTISSSDVQEGRHVTKVPDPKGTRNGSIFSDGHRALIVQDKDEESWGDRSKVELTLQSIDGQRRVVVRLSRVEGWFTNGYIGDPVLQMDVLSAEGVDDVNLVHSGPAWNSSLSLNGTRGVSPLAATFQMVITDEDNGISARSAKIQDVAAGG